jgi:hypothetical protein
LSLANICTLNFVTTGFTVIGENGGPGLGSPSFPSPTVVLNMDTVSISDQPIPKACCSISNNLTLDLVFYNSNDSELKDSFG